MHIKPTLTLLVALASFTLQAQTPSPSLTGRWTITADFYGTTRYQRLDLTRQAEKLTGKLNGDPLEGTLTGTELHFLVKDEYGNTSEVKATSKDGTLTGTFLTINVDEKQHPLTYAFTATLTPPRPTAPPQRHHSATSLPLPSSTASSLPSTSPSSPSTPAIPSTPPPSTPEVTIATTSNASPEAIPRPVPSTSSPRCPVTPSSSTSTVSASTATPPAPTTAWSKAPSTATWPSR